MLRSSTGAGRCTTGPNSCSTSWSAARQGSCRAGFAEAVAGGVLLTGGADRCGSTGAGTVAATRVSGSGDGSTFALFGTAVATAIGTETASVAGAAGAAEGGSTTVSATGSACCADERAPGLATATAGATRATLAICAGAEGPCRACATRSRGDRSVVAPLGPLAGCVDLSGDPPSAIRSTG
jgi:hypothetical protein